ncbi:hypothetical protein BH23VER1_BH23VER1_09180 [soil metagenome]
MPSDGNTPTANTSIPNELVSNWSHTGFKAGIPNAGAAIRRSPPRAVPDHPSNIPAPPNANAILSFIPFIIS